MADRGVFGARGIPDRAQARLRIFSAICEGGDAEIEKTLDFLRDGWIENQQEGAGVAGISTEMTEKEARQAMADAWSQSGGQICEPLWKATKKALGLEFKPEPIPLPEQLQEHEGRLVPGGANPLMAVLPWAPELLAAINKEAIARYEAYPRLRAAAQSLHDEMLWSDPDIYGPRLNACLREVGVELVKGPKS